MKEVSFRLSHQGHKVRVAPERAAEAAAMDANHDRYISNQELTDYCGADNAGRLNENKWHLRGLPNPDAAAYSSNDDIARDFAALEQSHPDVCERVCLGRSEEGRPIWALHVTDNVHADATGKTGIVITGLHHAREWMTTEVTGYTAHQLVDDRERLQKGDFWIVPVANPDGLEYSRETDNMWRKNRAGGVGVDLNRNYFDPAHPGLYRPDWDKPDTTADDSERGADDPSSNVFRGPGGASEPETQVIQELKFRPHMRAAVDFHSFGEAILYPFSYTKDAPPDVATWREIGAKMGEAAGGEVAVHSSADLYPISGGPLDVAYMRGLVAFEVELNECFQPSPEAIAPTCERWHDATMAFADEVLRRAEAGQLPERK